MLSARWRVHLLGGLLLDDGQARVTRLPSRAAALLLARLALAPGRAHAREELVELLWPGVAADVGRNRLRQTLSVLRARLEPPGAQPPQPVIEADRDSLRVVPGTLWCDAEAFERLLRAGHLAAAQALYRGELLPGHYDDWVADERLRLAALAERLDERLNGRLAPPPDRPTAPRPAETVAAGAASTAAASTAAEADRPPLRSPLPGYLTRLVGADDAVAALARLLPRQRLVTLYGPGGVGKTRLAVEAARVVSAATPAPFERVVFVSWVACTEPAAALDALAAALGLSSGAADPLAALVQALSGRRLLLVLDNAEQLADTIAPALARLLADAPGLHLLVTSRRVLGLDGEHELAVGCLPLPPADADLAAAAGNPAVALFVERARAVRSDFHLSARNAATLAALVCRLDGLPLAIELAAARVRSIGPAQLLQRLLEPGTPQLDLLARSGPRGGHDARHASMQRTLDASWQALAPDAARLLGLLAVFAAGCDATAAQAVARGLMPPGTVLLHLDDLVAASMLQAQPVSGDDPSDDAGLNDGSALRVTLHQALREYAIACLDDEALRDAHARQRAWALAWVRALPATPPLAALRTEMPNLVQALASAVADGAPDDAIRLLLALGRALEDVELPAAGLAAALAAVDASTNPALRAEGHAALASRLYIAGRADAALDHAQRGLQGPFVGPVPQARALHALARVLWRSRRDGAAVDALLDEAQALLGDADAAGVRPDTAALQGSLHALRAFVANGHHRDMVRGEHLHALALACWQRSGNRHAVGSGRYNLAVCATNAGRHADAVKQLLPLIDEARRQGDWRRVSQSLNVLGNAQCGLRQWAQAARAYRDSLASAWRALAPLDTVLALWNLPRALAHLRRPEAAARLMGFALAHWQAGFGALGPADRHDRRRLKRLVRVQCGAAACDAAWAEGEGLALADAVAAALAQADASA